jgi:hypothetical protein
MKNMLVNLKKVVIVVIITMTVSTGKAYSQSDQTKTQTENRESKKTKIFNEGGYVTGITPARAIGLAELLLAILSIVYAIRAKKRSSNPGAKVALLLGFLAIIFSIIHFVTTAGAVFGSGSGKAGAILAILLSLVGITLAGLALRQNKV